MHDGWYTARAREKGTLQACPCALYPPGAAACENSDARLSHVYLFYNPTSGGNAAGVLAHKVLRQGVLWFANHAVLLKLYDIRVGKPGNKPGFQNVAARIAALAASPTVTPLSSPVTSSPPQSSSSPVKPARHAKPPPPPRPGPRSYSKDLLPPLLLPTVPEEADQQEDQGDQHDKDHQSSHSSHPPGGIRLACGRVMESRIRVVAGGGDGTVMWAINELRAHHIDMSRVVLGVIPFGTGNDFARALHWTNSAAGLLAAQHSLATAKREVRSLVYCWLRSMPVRHDLWTVKVFLKEYGVLSKIDASTRKKMILLDPSTNAPLRYTQYALSNYFSVGVESRIGVGFDRYRTKSTFLNKLRYIAEGVKKTAFKTTRRIDEIIERITATENGQPVTVCVCSTDITETPPPDYLQMTTANAFRPYVAPARQSPHMKAPLAAYCQRKRELRTLKFQQRARLVAGTDKSKGAGAVGAGGGSGALGAGGAVAASFGGAFTAAARRSHTDLADEAADDGASCCSSSGSSISEDLQWFPPSPRRLNRRGKQTASSSEKARELMSAASLVASNIPSFAAGLDVWGNARRSAFSSRGSTDQLGLERQLMGDGKLELLTFPSAASFGLERVMGLSGNGRRLCQGPGPFVLHFRTLPRDWRVYYQVDGEFYQMNNPDRVEIHWDCCLQVLAKHNSPHGENYVRV